MEFLFVIDAPGSLKAYKDTTVAMMRAAQKRGHTVWICEQEHLQWRSNLVHARAQRISLADNDEDWYRAHQTETRELKRFNATLMRKDPPFDLEYVASTWLLSEAERQGAKVINSPRALRDHNEKFAIAEFSRFTVPSLVSRSMNDLQTFIEEHKTTVLKRLDGMGGTGIFVVKHDDTNRNSIVETISVLGTRSVMAQRYIPEIKDGDKRVLLIDGKVVPHCLARIPKAGESRGNLAAGARGVAQPITKRHREIAEALGPVLAKRGLLLVGLDVIGDWLTEVNVTSPTCFREIQDQAGFDVSGMFLDALEKGRGMIGVLVVSHGSIGESLVTSAQQILGKPLPQVATLSVWRQDDPDDLVLRARELLDSLDAGDGVLVITDIFGATPGNVVSRLLQDGRIEGVSGASLPMLLRVLTSRNGSLSAAVQRALTGGAEGVVHMNSDKCCDA